MSIEEGTPASEASKAAGYEVTDAQPSPVVVALVVLVGLMFAGFVGGKVFEDIFEATEVKSRPAVGPLEVRETVSGPLLQPHPEVELEGYLADQKAKLGSYAWIDRDQGKVRIPVERAMQLVARDGIPVWKPTEAKLPAKPAAPAPTPAPASSEGASAPGAGEAEGAGEAADAAHGSETVGSAPAAETPSVGTPDDEPFTGTESLPE